MYEWSFRRPLWVVMLVVVKKNRIGDGGEGEVGRKKMINEMIKFNFDFCRYRQIILNLFFDFILDSLSPLNFCRRKNLFDDITKVLKTKKKRGSN
mgnify:CR=1 FL=1